MNPLCLFGWHKWGPWLWIHEGLTIGSWWERECRRKSCQLIEQRDRTGVS